VYIVTIDTQGGNMRTNIIIDDKLMSDAIGVSGYKTKKETVEEALKLMIKIKGQSAIRAYRGKIHWEGDLESMRID